jgi:hypothetical protein
MSKSPLSIELKLGYKEVSNDRQIKYSSTTVFATATVDQLSLGGCNDAIVIVVGDTEGCHLPLSINLVLQLVWQRKSNPKQLAITRQKKSQVFFCPLFYRPLFYGDPVENLQDFPFCPVLRSETRLHLMCGFMF